MDRNFGCPETRPLQAVTEKFELDNKLARDERSCPSEPSTACCGHVHRCSVRRRQRAPRIFVRMHHHQEVT